MNPDTEVVLRKAVESREARREAHATYLATLVAETREVEGWIADLDREIAGLRADLPAPADVEFPGSYAVTIGLAHLVDPFMRDRPLCGAQHRYAGPIERRDIPLGASWLCDNCRRLAPAKGYWRG